MRRLVKLFAVAVLAATAGAWTLPGQGQLPGGLPPGVIAKNPAESELSITVRMGNLFYLQGAAAADFVRFRINQEAFVYLYEVAPDGEVRLLFPNRSAPENFLAAGEYAFPEDFMPGFSIGAEGTYTVQAIAALRPIFGLEAGTGTQLFRRLGDDPETVRQGVELLIRQSRLLPFEWSADWTQYEVVRTQPTAGGVGQVTVLVKDPQGNPIRDALIKIDQVDEQGNPVGDRPLVDWRTVGTKYQRSLAAGVRWRFFARRPLFFVPDPQTDCTVHPVGEEERSIGLSPCILELVAGDHLIVTLTLEPVERQAIIDIIQPPRSNPFCTGERVEFDASKSRPQDQIRQYIWTIWAVHDGERDEVRTEFRAREEPVLRHNFRNPGLYEVELRVLYQDNEIRTTRETVQVVDSATHPNCKPPLGPETVGEAQVTVEPPEFIEFEIRNGYAIAPVPSPPFPVALPSGDTLVLRFEFTIQDFPSSDVQAGNAIVMSYVGLRFVDEGGNPVLSGAEQQNPVVLFTVQPGILPVLGQLQKVSQRIPIPEGARGLQLFLVGSVFANAFASEEPFVIRYQGFRVERDPSPPAPDCARLRTGGTAGGIFQEKQMFRWLEPVTFQLENDCEQELRLSDDGWWRIVDTQTGQEIFRTATPGPAVPAGESLTWSWDQRTTQGQVLGFNQVNRIYRLEVRTEEGAVIEALFFIVP